MGFLVSPWLSAPLFAQRIAPYPPSPVITSLTWAPVEEIRRAANGSDTFPITWGDDGMLYTAFADGNGFEPTTEQKLSLGFAFVTGGPTDYAGSNIRSGQEQLGDGAAGMKASGMLMVDGTLYMWMRNANNSGRECRLAWSTDRARTWTFSDWNFAEFGYCTFINYGQNYAGAPGGYVYTVTPDSPSAYEPSDGFVLLRAPKTDMANRLAYQYFAGMDDGEPIWTTDIEEKDYIFYNQGNSLRSGMSYNAALNRYIWWQQLPNLGSEDPEDTRGSGGFGVYDAPEPWGPWTTVYYTENWDVGPGETGSFPTKWISPDGLTMYLVFSGDDSFSVRRAMLTVSPQSALPDVVAEEQAQPTATLVPQLPTPVQSTPVENPPVQPPVENPPDSAASNLPEQPQSPLPTPTETLVPPPTPTETLIPAPQPTPPPLEPTFEPSPTLVMSPTAPISPTALITQTEALSPTVVVAPNVAVSDTAPEGAPGSGSVATLPMPPTQTDPLSALLRSDMLILSLLCVIFFAVMMLGFGALMVNVFYIRSRRQRGY